MATTNLDAEKLRVAPSGGLVHENVMDKIWDISNVPLPFTDAAGTGSVSNKYTEWVQDKLPAPDLTNARIDGQDTNTTNDTVLGIRLGNHCQISTKTVQVSERADASNTIGVSNTTAYQVARRQISLRRDVEAIVLSVQGSIEDDGNTTPGKAGSVFSFIKTNAVVGATGSVPGFNNGTKLTGTVVPGTPYGLTETALRNVAQSVYVAGGGDTSTLLMMVTPQVNRIWSEYCFTSSARIATLINDQGTGKQTAVGAVNVFETDFGILKIVPNRVQQQTSAGTSSVGIFDMAYIDMSYLIGYRIEDLAKTGLSTKKQLAVDWTCQVYNEAACGALHGINEATAVVH
jgi:hypothetical protein